MRILPDTIQQFARVAPTREAFRCDGKSLTYAGLLARSRQLAHLLIDKGVRPGERVAVSMPRCLESATAIYGIMQAGAAWVPIDPGMPDTMLQQVCTDCGIEHFVTVSAQQERMERLVSAGIRLRHIMGLEPQTTNLLASSWDDLAEYSEAPPHVRIDEHDLAYVIYTSGSTGRPKGIIHTHCSGLSYARLTTATWKLTANDRIGSHSPLHFDMGTFGYLAGPFAGATTVLISEAYTMMPASLSQLMQDERLTVWYSVPFALMQLLHRGALESRDASYLRAVVFAGEVFPTKHLKRLMKLWPQAEFSNAYGPTETNVCTTYQVPRSILTEQDDAAGLPIGQPWGETSALIVDEALEPVDDGAAGELLIHSTTLMREYWKRPDLNEHAFVSKTTSANPETRYYRTGDLVRRNDDGQLELLGRIDRQIKLRGYRIELDAVESAIIRHPQVREAAVFMQESPDDATQNVIATAVVADDNELSVARLREYLTGCLPAYAVPTQINITHTILRTSTGKLDRNALAQSMNESV